MKAFRITLTGPRSVTLKGPLERAYLIFALTPTQARTIFVAWFCNHPNTLTEPEDAWSIRSISEESPDKILWLH